jgi:hypothetical protein
MFRVNNWSTNLIIAHYKGFFYVDEILTGHEWSADAGIAILEFCATL